MVSISELLDWKPKDLATVADELVKKRKTLLDLQDEIDGAQPPSDWHTEAGRSARSAHVGLRDRLNDMVAEVSDVIITLDTASTALETAKSTVKAQKELADGKGFTISEEGGSVTVKASAEVAKDNPDADTQCSEIAKAISDALTDAQNADTDLNSSLTAATNGTTEGGEGSLADAAVQLPPELDNLSPTNMALALDKNPELLDVEGVPQAVQQHLDLGSASGSKDGQSFENNPTASKDVLGRQSVAAQLAEHAQKNDSTVDPELASYLDQFYEKSDGQLIEGSKKIGDVYGTGEGSPGALFQQGLADGALLMTDSKLDGSAQFFGQDDIKGKGDNNGMPPELYRAMKDGPSFDENAETYPEGFTLYNSEVNGGEGLKEFSSFMKPSSAAGGEEFSRDASLTMADLAGKFQDRDPNPDHQDDRSYRQFMDEWSPFMEGTVDVASRNPEANSDLFGDAAKDKDLAERVTNLYTFEWSDNGAAMSGYMNTINEDLKAPVGSDEHNRGVEASARMTDFMTSTPGKDGEGMNVYERLMTGAAYNDPNSINPQYASMGEVNPLINDGLVKVMSGNFGDFGTPATADDTTYEDGHINANAGDRSRLFTLAHTDPESGKNLNIAMGAWEQTELDRAMAVKDDPDTEQDERLDAVTSAGTKSGQLEGLSTAGMYNQHLITGQGDWDNADEAYRDQLAAANLGKTAVTFGLGNVPGAGGALSTGSGLVMDELIDKYITEPEAPSGASFDGEGVVDPDEQVNDRRAAHNYVSALIRSGEEVPTDVKPLLDENGKLPPYDTLSGPDKEKVFAGLNHDDPRWEAYQEGYKPAEPYEANVLDQDGSAEKGTKKDDDYLKGKIK